jgi:hypothetical protein
MAENGKEKSGTSRNPVQMFVMIFCVAGTIALVAVCVLFARYYDANKDYIEGRAVVLKGVEPPDDRASQQTVGMWLSRYERAMPGCLCALGRSKSPKTDSAMLLCIGFTEKCGATDACEMKPEKLPPGVTMNVSPRQKPGRRQKVVFLLSLIFSKRIVSCRTGLM